MHNFCFLSYANVSIMYYKVMSLKLLYGEITYGHGKTALSPLSQQSFPLEKLLFHNIWNISSTKYETTRSPLCVYKREGKGNKQILTRQKKESV